MISTQPNIDIAAASERIKPFLLPTPTLQNSWLNNKLDRVALLKAECLNVTGSFKIRGALNRMLCIEESKRQAGVVAMSSGNHAQAVAQAARWLGIRATIVMPEDAPKIKLANTRALGARVVLYNRTREDREAIARKIAQDHGATLVHPFDHHETMAGQGTCGLELVDYAKQHRLQLDCVAAPCSGGGLIAGVGTAVRAHFPNAAIVAVEPIDYNDHQLSLEAGERIELSDYAPTLCDALQAPTPGERTFAVNQTQLSSAVTVTDTEVGAAMAVAAQRLKLVLEPGGAAALAALLQNRLPIGSGAVGIILSGGNVDTPLFAQVLKEFGDQQP